jgi:lipoteichoic acid synthase
MRRRWLLELGPLAAVVALLWVKLVYFSALLPGEWWAPEETIRQWMRQTSHVLGALLVHPHVLGATLAALLVLAALLPLAPRIWRFVALLSLDVFLTSVGLIDLVHVRFYADVVSYADVIRAPMLVGILPRVIESLPTTNAVYYLDILAGLLLAPWYVRACQRTPRLDHRSLTRVSVGLLGAGLVLAAPTVRTAWPGGREIFGYSSPRLETAAAIGILPYHLGDVAMRLARARPDIGGPERQRVRHFMDELSRKRGSASPLFGRALGRNVVVVNAESLQAFPIGLTINGRPVTPHLSAFARESLHFVNFYDQTHLGTTSDAELAAMQSLHPLATGVLSNHFSGNQYRGLPRVLAEHGYTTLSACAAPDNFWSMSAMHPRLGFQRSFFEGSYRIRERIGPWLSDHEFFAQTTPILTTQPTPFMAFLLTASNHHPYRLPPEHRRLSLGVREGTLLGDYLQSVHYFDRAFGEFVDQLRKAGLLETSLVVLYGDHQGFLGDPPDLARLLGFPAGDEFRTLQVRKRLPLLIRLPRGEEASVKLASGGHLDVAPTVLALAGINDDEGVMLGRDLTQERASLVVFRDGSFTDGRHWYVHRVGSPTAGTCYEVATGRAIGCGILEEQRRQAWDRLEVSDLIVRGDLIPTVTAHAAVRDRGEP